MRLLVVLVSAVMGAVALVFVTSSASTADAEVTNLQAPRVNADTRTAVEARVASQFAAMDADGDGRVTEAEAVAVTEAGHTDHRARMFDRFDSDSDGELSSEERTAFLSRPRGRNRGAADDAATAQAGTSATAGSQAGTRGRWATADIDGNGSLSRDEFVGMTEGHAGRARQRGRDPRGDFTANDADGDGVVTLAEMSARELAAFDAADSDGDGTLNDNERAASRQARSGRRDRTNADN